MSTLVLYVNGHAIHRREVVFPPPEKRLDRHGRIDWRKAHIDNEIAKIKILFYKQILKYEYKIILELKSKMNDKRKSER